MNYRHAYHAGNFADVLKHAALVAVLAHLKKKPTPFAVIDSHAGRGLYDLTGDEALKTAEAEGGIARLLTFAPLPGVLADYAELVRGFSGIYPGSPVIALKSLRATDRLVAIEKHPEEFAALNAALGNDKRTRAINGDAYTELQRLMPPRERRGIVLIDPPYESEAEFADAIGAVLAAHRRFATGIYLFWYPAKDRAAIAAAAGELLTGGVKSLLQIELDIGEAPPRADGRGPPLSATGLFVVNPPYGFAAEMQVILPFLVACLGRGPSAASMLKVLAGEG